MKRRGKRYRTERLQTIAGYALIALLLAMLVVFTASCRSVRTIAVDKPIYIHDTLHTESVRVDSVEVTKWHTEYMQGDTVRLIDSVYIRQKSYKHDTIREIQEKPVEVEKVIEVERKQTKLHKIMIGSGVALWLVVFIVATGIILRKLERK
jgi:hypothetical protein